MSERMIQGRDGSTTIITDSYAPFGQTNIGPPVRPENPELYKIVRLTEQDICKARGWTPEQLQIARDRLGFPKGEGRTSSSAFSWSVKRWTTWAPAEVDRWFEAFDSVK